jgi:hypothetical protein
VSASGYYLKNITANLEFNDTSAFTAGGDEDSTTTMKLFGSGTNTSVTCSQIRFYYFDTYDNGNCI